MSFEFVVCVTFNYWINTQDNQLMTLLLIKITVMAYLLFVGWPTYSILVSAGIVRHYHRLKMNILLSNYWF